MSDLKDINTWRAQLGLLPVPLFDTHGNASEYILLNGTRGSFCLYLNGREPGPQARSEAWSANVGHSVFLAGDDVYVQRWDEPHSPDLHRLAKVRADLEEFHRSLERDTPPSELSIVAHAVRVFRRLRAAFGESVKGVDALEAFLVLLVSALEGVDRKKVDHHRWQLDEDARSLALELDAATWDTLVEEMLGGHKLDDLRTRLELTLRHASGMLFQEAHYAAVFDSSGQLSLPGLPPSPVSVTPRTTAVGLHFTPPAIVRTIVEEALLAWGGADEITVFDPACGSGEFLRESLRQLSLKGYTGSVRLIGFDSSSAACAVSRFVLAQESRGIADRVKVQIECRDALTAPWPRDVDLLLMNPPFQSWTDMDAALRETVVGVLGELAGHRANLSAAFLWKALGSLADKGVLGTILPAPFLDGVAFGILRDALAERLSTLLVARLGSHDLFHQALVDACFYIGRCGPQEGAPLALWASHLPSSNSAALRMLRRLRAVGEDGSVPVDSETEGFSLYRNPGAGTKGEVWAPRPYRKWKISQAVKELPRVGEQFDVRQGTLTGLNKAFILDKADWLRLPEREQPYFRTAVFHESLRNGRVFDEAYVFFPYAAYALESEAELKKRVPTYYKNILSEYKATLQKRRGIESSVWWRLTWPREWQAKRVKKIVSAYFGDAGSFAWDSDGSIVVVQGYSWLAKADLRRDTWLAYLAILNSEVFSALLAAHSNHVSGGQWNLSKRFLEPIPLPDLYSRRGEDEIQSSLARLGGKIHSNGLESLSSDEMSRLSKLAETIYLSGKGDSAADGDPEDR